MTSDPQKPPTANVSIDLDTIRDKVPTFPSEKLCEMIVCDRYFGCFRDVAIICMEELARRRTAGDLFDFEDHIRQAQQELPKLDFNIPNIREALQRASKK